jgi:hypothetical protein
MLKGGVIVFLYVDGIVFGLQEGSGSRRSNKKGTGSEISWFLGSHVLRDRRSRKLWHSQQRQADRD